ncbi:TPA: bifunctional adenosylcobinamide kinase/adenosylcobinamide-phosphate guanylyltransferase [Vibrio vulnificus]|nr:bifunctional adenosylcobinamide kinase/adenosylcobinamide-phosphate guanylyltransferase [Vibrio vulnificus]
MTMSYSTNKALVLGGARSGKSRFAEQLARQWSQQPDAKCHYVATAVPFDQEMAERIHHHRQQRGQGWCEHEAPLYLAERLSQFGADDVVLVDCLTVWLNNWLFEFGEQASNEKLEQKVAQLASVVKESPAQIILVSNEVGLGVVPLGQISRLFVDNAGRMNQSLAQVCDNVTLIAAGLPLILKSSGHQ